jgi:hypothetical protein
MPRSDKLPGWVRPHGDCIFFASFVGGGATNRLPATQLCNSPNEANHWIEEEAAEISAPIEWLNATPEKES